MSLTLKHFDTIMGLEKLPIIFKQDICLNEFVSFEEPKFQKTFISEISQSVSVAITANIFGQKKQQEYSVSFEYFDSPFQLFKDRYFPKFLKERFKPKKKTATKKIKFDHHSIFPHRLNRAGIAFTQLSDDRWSDNWQNKVDQDKLSQILHELCISIVRNQGLAGDIDEIQKAKNRILTELM